LRCAWRWKIGDYYRHLREFGMPNGRKLGAQPGTIEEERVLSYAH